MSSLFPENLSSYGTQVDYLYDLILYIITPWTLLTFGGILLSCILYWRFWSEEGSYFDGHETVLSLGSLDVPSSIFLLEIPTLLVLGLDLWIFGLSLSTWNNIKVNTPEEIDYRMGVTGKQFGWDFTYPGPDGELNTNKDRPAFELHLPAEESIQVQLTSDDVIHSFFVPNLRIKQDTVPGRKLKEWLRISKDKIWGYAKSQSSKQLRYVEEKLMENGSSKAKELISALQETRKQLKPKQEESAIQDARKNVTGVIDELGQMSEQESPPISEDKRIEVLGNLERVSDILTGVLQKGKGIPVSIYCAELCGTGHPTMTATMKIHPTEDGFLQWRKENLDY